MRNEFTLDIENVDITAFVVFIIAIHIILILFFGMMPQNKHTTTSYTTPASLQETYKDYLIRKIPIAQQYLKFNADGNLCEAEKLHSELQHLVYDSVYLFNRDRAFFSELREQCNDLDAYLVQLSHQALSVPSQKDAQNEIDARIKEIYRHIGRKYATE